MTQRVTTARSSTGTALQPIVLSRKQAAEYIGVGTTLFDAMVDDGRMPAPIEINSRRIWDRIDIEFCFRALKNGRAAGGQDDNPKNDWEDAAA